MNPAAPYRSKGQKLGELSLWTGASILVLSAHIAAAALLLQDEPPVPSEGAPPAAIMIELAAEPEAVNTEEEQIAPDAADAEEIESDQTEPVEEAQPEPPPEPVEQPPEVADLPEPPPPEPVIEEPAPEPEPEIAEPLPEPPPEPVEEIDPIEQQITAALENVEVPLPIVRPPPPPEKPAPKKAEQRKQPQAQKERAQAKAQVRQSDRNAASQTSNSAASAPSVSPTRWMTRVRAKIARNARRCPGGDKGVVAVSFTFDGGGNIGRVSVAQSSGNSSIDEYVASAVRRASPIPAPPSGVASFLTQAVECK
jgi:periplasmic protein TonB